MAVYKKLLLSAGGGIISTSQQAEQVGNTATILIGLGGTGIDCLRTIKTQVHARLKPDDPNAVTPEYAHIRFLGVDTDENSRGAAGSNENIKADSMMTLDDTEFFSIGNPDVKKALSNSLALKKRTELSWLRWEDIRVPNLSKAGAGGIRQIGRFMMMDQSDSFRSRLEQEISAAKSGLSQPPVHIHIFSGLSGGTGAGSFLDVCYMVKDIATSVSGVTIYGYFFLPDVNLSKIPYSDNLTRVYIRQNGYAAMQELDYCMQLQFNGGGFVQEYKGHRKIEWKSQPVDMCHLICATDQNGNVIPNAYDYAMNVVTEYIMDFLTRPNDAKNFGLDSQLSNFIKKTDVGNSDKKIGVNLAYCIIGASCAIVPLREINTYLASESFNRFSHITDRVPSRSDVEDFAIDALAKGARNLEEIYNSLYDMLLEGNGTEYNVYIDDWKYVSEYGNSDFELHFTNQTAAKKGQIVTNAKGMMTTGNKNSLLGRVNAQLFAVMKDLDRGPKFAQNLLSASMENNFLNIIDGLTALNTTRYKDEAAQTEKRERDCKHSQDAFEEKCSRAVFNNAKKEFGEYENCRMLLEQHRLLMEIYEVLDEVFICFRKQVADAESAYYAKFARVMDTLVQTFRENRNALESNTMLKTNDMFAAPMMTIQELKPSLDARIKKIEPQGMFDMFVRMMTENAGEWILEDENKITRLVTYFFTKQIFSDFADRTITSFLQDKYSIPDNDDLLASKIYDDWIEPLTFKASPLFYLDKTIWDRNENAELASLSVPEISTPIQNAAKKMYGMDNKWKVNCSALTDRIYVMRSACAIPLGSYNYSREYEQEYAKSNTVGCHYYEGKPVERMDFSDWGELSSIRPQSIIELDKVPEKMRKIISRGQKLYEEADQCGVFDVKNRICQPDRGRLSELIRATDACNKFAEKLSSPVQLEEGEALLEKLEIAKKLPMIPTDCKMADDGYAGDLKTKKDIQKDYFISSPAYHGVVERILAEVKTPLQEAVKAELNLKARISKVRFGDREMQDYFEALFTGVITHEARSVLYKNENTFEEIVLSKRGEEFAFYEVPPYQGYISYEKLSEETKKKIKEAVDRCFENEQELIAAGNKLRDVLTGERLEGWESLADNFAERNDILALLRKLKKGFADHCKTL